MFIFFGAEIFSITKTLVTEEDRVIFCMDPNKKLSYNGAEHYKDAHKSKISSLFEISQK